MPPAEDKTKVALTEKQLSALVTLLGDEDPVVWQHARGRLIEAGEPALVWLRKNQFPEDLAARRRIAALLDEDAARATDAEFTDFIQRHGDNFDLEEGIWRFVCTTYPRESMNAWQALMDDYAERIREKVPAGAEARDVLVAINTHLFDTLGLRGNDKDYYDAENSYPNRVIERRLGIPISLSAIYLMMTRRLALPVTGIGMPGHFLCRLQTAREEIFIDPFYRGKLLTRAECKKRIQNLAVQYDDSQLLPVNSRRFLQRLVANLHVIYRECKDRAASERLQRYLVTLSR